ncbi:glyoxalase-like domain protein [mine drainage metagenome]|uniref:Glyoxalase-like domain protein n=1 Tax=mine drainage metagenome TaxID=410659 RepID=A0A1J5PJX7_9ZZZZ
MAIGRYSATVLDCPDPIALANFYGAITGWPINAKRTWRDESGTVGWAELSSDEGAALGFELVDDYCPPTWPEGEVPQQAHLDFEVANLDIAEGEVLRIGATKADFQPGTDLRVFFDPAGHPFCLVRGDE